MKWYNFSNFNSVIKGDQHPQISKCVIYILDELRYRKAGYEQAVCAMILSLMIETVKDHAQTSGTGRFPA